MSLFSNRVIVSGGGAPDRNLDYTTMTYNEAMQDGNTTQVTKVTLPSVVAVDMSKIILMQQGIRVPNYFVYVEQNGFPTPQIWYGKQTDGQGKDNPTLQIHELPTTIDLTKTSVDDLKALFPYKPKLQS